MGSLETLRVANFSRAYGNSSKWESEALLEKRKYGRAMSKKERERIAYGLQQKAHHHHECHDGVIIIS